MNQMSLFDPAKAKVTQSNQFVNARYRLSAQENRMLKLVFAQVEPYAESFKPYMVYLEDFETITDTKHKFSVKECKVFAEGLMKQHCEIPPEDHSRRAKGGWVKASLFSSLEYLPEERGFEVLLDPKLERYFLHLKEKFTSFCLLYATRPSSFNSQRIYEMIQEQSFRGFALFDVDELKESLMLEGSYKNYNDLEKRVILQAKKEFDDKCDLSFELPVTRYKKGNKVKQIKLNLVHNYDVISKDSSLFEATENDSLLDELNQLGIAQKEANKIIKSLDSDEIRSKIKYVKAQFSSGKVKSNLSGYLYKVLTSDSIIGNTIYEKELEKIRDQQNEQQKIQKGQQNTEQLEIKGLLQGFEEFFDGQINQFRKINNFENEVNGSLWLEFEKDVKNYATTLKQTYGDLWKNNSVNMECDKYEEIVHSFIAGKLGGYSKNFRKWAYEMHGYVLSENRSTETNFSIQSRQEIML